MNTYYKLARAQELSGNTAPALLLYLSSFCESLYHHELSVGTVNKIRRLQLAHGISDFDLCLMVRSYWDIPTKLCQQVLYAALQSDISQMRKLLEGHAYG